MARPTANPPFKLPDGRETPVTLQLRGAVYRVKFKSPGGKFVVATTGRTDIAGAWTEAAKVILAAFTPTQKIDLRKGTWEQALAELPKSRNGKTLRPRSLEAYTSRISVFRELIPGSRGPYDVTPEVAQEFADKYANGTFTKSKKSGAKQYKRCAETVATTVRVLSGLWSHLRKMNVVTFNPWKGVELKDPPNT